MNGVNRMFMINRVKYTSDQDSLKKIGMGNPDDYISSIAIRKLVDEDDLVDIAVNSKYRSNRSNAYHLIEDPKKVLTVYLKSGKRKDYVNHAAEYVRDDKILSEIVLDNPNNSTLYSSALKSITTKKSMGSLINKLDSIVSGYNNKPDASRSSCPHYYALEKAKEIHDEMGNSIDFLLDDEEN